MQADFFPLYVFGFLKQLFEILIATRILPTQTVTWCLFLEWMQNILVPLALFLVWMCVIRVVCSLFLCDMLFFWLDLGSAPIWGAAGANFTCEDLLWIVS